MFEWVSGFTSPCNSRLCLLHHNSRHRILFHFSEGEWSTWMFLLVSYPEVHTGWMIIFVFIFILSHPECIRESTIKHILIWHWSVSKQKYVVLSFTVQHAWFNIYIPIWFSLTWWKKHLARGIPLSLLLIRNSWESKNNPEHFIYIISCIHIHLSLKSRRSE